jgi:hypothetical protein
MSVSSLSVAQTVTRQTWRRSGKSPIFEFIHLESFSIEISEKQQLSDGYSSGLRRLFGLPTLVYLKLDIVIHQFSAFLELWGGFSPSIRHVELTTRLSFEDEPELDNPVVTPNPIQLDSLQVTLSHSNPLSDHFGMYRWALGPFDLSHLRTLSIRDDAGVPWERFASQTIQLLDVDVRVRINFHLYIHRLSALTDNPEGRGKPNRPLCSQIFCFCASRR